MVFDAAHARAACYAQQERESSELAGLGLDAAGTTTRRTGGVESTWGGRAASAFAVQLSNSITEVLAATDPLWNSRSTAAELHENVAASQSQTRPFNHHEKGNATASYYACFGYTHSNPLPARACVTPMKQLITMRCFGKPSEPKTKEDEANS